MESLTPAQSCPLLNLLPQLQDAPPIATPDFKQGTSRLLPRVFRK